MLFSMIELTVATIQMNKAEKEMYLEDELKRESNASLISLAQNGKGAEKRIARQILTDRKVQWN